ncbi:MAG TPA: C40 family peptidase [bacterium]
MFGSKTGFLKKRKKQAFLINVFLLAAFCSFGLAQQKTSVPDTVAQIIKQVQQKYRPDKRISRFEIISRLEGDTLILSGETLSADAKSELIARLNAETDYQIEDSLMMLPDAALGENIYGVVRVSVAQLRRNPDVIHEIVDQAIMGTEVKVLKIADRFWAYCQLDDDYLGWMMISSLEMGDINFLENWRKQDKLIVTANYGQIWERRKEQGLSVSDVVLGNILVNKGKKRSWYHVALADGRTGYIDASLVIEEQKYFAHLHPTAESMIALAWKFLGFPYLWGGRSTKGFDCSGFTQTVYKMHGITLPRDANMQVKSGVAVTIDDSFKSVKPGDLLFFGRDLDHIFHVGMYLGDAKFIHSDGMVRINSFNPKDENFSEYRMKGLQAVRRILTNE